MVGLAIYQGLIQLSEIAKRKRVYEQALSTARELNKPLVVVGGPLGGLTILEIIGIPVHGFGDLCIDTLSSACGNRNFMQASITEIPLPNKYAGAVYCSHVLEHLPNVQSGIKAIEELKRISDYQYVLVPSKLNLTAWFHPDHHLWVYNNPDGIVIEQR